MSSQTKTGSFVEAWTNVAIGFGLNYIANILIFPAFGYALSYSDAFWIGVIFTVISVIRSYYLRRLFNKIKSKWNRT